jgi:hypothetical protein
MLAIVTALATFALALMALTYASAFVADITGSFRLLFIQKPYRQAFRAVRWLVAGAAAVSVLVAME